MTTILAAEILQVIGELRGIINDRDEKIKELVDINHRQKIEINRLSDDLMKDTVKAN